MELKDYIQNELTGLSRSIKRITDTLTSQEMAWRPASGCNSIGLILFHVAKLEDSFVKTRVLNQPTLWLSEKWYEKLNLPESEDGAHYTVEQVNTFPPLDKEKLLAFVSAVQTQTRESLNGLSMPDLDRKVALFRGDGPIASVYAFIVFHASEHIGEMSYLRGLQRGMDK
ncbi:MAG: DinB family protein [Dehalococcoidales bacterium]|nr:DinB family protein [Dehalococcoidales bacterium]